MVDANMVAERTICDIDPHFVVLNGFHRKSRPRPRELQRLGFVSDPKHLVSDKMANVSGLVSVSA